MSSYIELIPLTIFVIAACVVIVATHPRSE